MILHFVKDEKIVDQTIENFSTLNPNDIFLVFDKSLGKSFIHITKNNKTVIRFNYLAQDINTVLHKYNPTSILIHAMYLEFAKAILDLKKNIKIGWVVWGFDVYSLPKIAATIYAPRTELFLRKSNRFFLLKRNISKYGFLRMLYFLINRSTEDKIAIIKKALKRINYFVTYVEEDYEVLCKYYPNNLQLIYCPFNNIDQYLGGSKELRLNSDYCNILIGNSNTPECNHLDVFCKISNQISSMSKIFVTLSYGPNEVYKEEVIKRGRELFSDSFVPIIDFVSRTSYINVLQNCSVGIFYHYRQQAMGNIIAMLYMGARVYLSLKNPAYNFFVRNGIEIFDLDNDFQTYGATKLETELAENNRKILDKIFGKEKVQNDILNLTQVLSN